MIEIKFTINGEQKTLSVAPQKRLLDVIREDLTLTGTKEGCAVGECGACTVIMNKKAVASCLVLAVQADGAVIETVEFLEQNGTLCALQQAFLDNGAVQCGFCTPGMLMSAKALLDRNPHPDEAEIRTAIEGNLCRCTGYLPIIKAIKSLSEK